MASKTRKTESGETVDFFVALPKDQAYIIRQKLLEGLPTETDRGLRNKISDAVAEVGRQYSEISAFSPYPNGTGVPPG